MTSGELARYAGVTLRTVRYYEEKGLLHREAEEFPEKALITLKKIKLLQEAGYRLDEIDTALATINRKPSSHKERQQALEHLLQDTQQKIQEKLDALTALSVRISEVLELSDTCSNCGAAECAGCSRLTTWEAFGYDAKE